MLSSRRVRILAALTAEMERDEQAQHRAQELTEGPKVVGGAMGGERASSEQVRVLDEAIDAAAG